MREERKKRERRDRQVRERLPTEPNNQTLEME